MKKLISMLTMLTVFALCAMLFCSCSQTEEYDPWEGKNIVKSDVQSGELTSWMADTREFDAVNELSTQVIKCKVKGINKLETTVMGTISFKLDVEVEDIYLDIGDQLNVGDSIVISTNNALMTANDVLEKLSVSDARNYNILQDGPYGENDYVLYSAFDGTPMELNGSYIIYLTDRYFDSEGVYADIGYSHVYAIKDSGIYVGDDITKSDMNERELIKFVKDGIEARTGRVQEVGEDQYLSELAERQAAERAE